MPFNGWKGKLHASPVIILHLAQNSYPQIDIFYKTRCSFAWWNTPFTGQVWVYHVHSMHVDSVYVWISLELYLLYITLLLLLYTTTLFDFLSSSTIWVSSPWIARRNCTLSALMISYVDVSFHGKIVLLLLIPFSLATSHHGVRLIYTLRDWILVSWISYI